MNKRNMVLMAIVMVLPWSAKVEAQPAGRGSSFRGMQVPGGISRLRPGAHGRMGQAVPRPLFVADGHLQGEKLGSFFRLVIFPTAAPGGEDERPPLGGLLVTRGPRFEVSDVELTFEDGNEGERRVAGLTARLSRVNHGPHGGPHGPHGGPQGPHGGPHGPHGGPHGPHGGPSAVGEGDRGPQGGVISLQVQGIETPDGETRPYTWGTIEATGGDEREFVLWGFARFFHPGAVHGADARDEVE